MAISLYDATVGSFLQVLGGVTGFLDRGLAHCRDNNIDPAEIVETRLWGDMQPFRFQVLCVAHHSLGAIEAVKKGVFSPPTDPTPYTYEQLQARVAEARAGLEKMTPAEVNALEGRDVTFQAGDYKSLFVAEGFLLSLSLPNFHFHATTAYDILRSKGVPIGKRDYIGQLKRKS